MKNKSKRNQNEKFFIGYPKTTIKKIHFFSTHFFNQKKMDTKIKNCLQVRIKIKIRLDGEFEEIYNISYFYFLFTFLAILNEI